MALPPGRARLSTKPAPTGSTTFANTIGTVRVACSNGATIGVPVARMTSGASATNSAAYLRKRRHRPRPSGSRSARCGRRSSPIAAAPAGTPRCGPVLPDRPRRAVMSTPMRRTRSACCARAASGHARRAAEQRDELAPSHSITSSARASSVGGTSRPSALAVLRLMTSSNLVGA